MEKPHLEIDITPAHRMAKYLIGEAIMSIQQVSQICAADMVALIGQELGDMLACADCKIEKRESIVEGSPEWQPYKQTMLLNFEMQYNRHRSKHEREDCVKPEPKIV